MADSLDAGGPGFSRGKIVLAGGLAGLVLIGLVAYLGGGPGDGDKAPGPNGPWMMNTPYTAPGIKRPVTVPADAALLDDETAIIGISAGGKQRAYVVRAFDRPLWHVVNDLLGEVAITVTYCDRCDSVRAFIGREPGVALDVSVGGWVNNQMLLRLGNVFFMQDTGQANTAAGTAEVLPTYPHERTTWKAWKTAHPDTDVYTGSSERRAMEEGATGPDGP